MINHAQRNVNIDAAVARAMVGQTAKVQEAGLSTEGLTPDMLMLYCKRRLNSLDDEIRTAMKGQENLNALKSEIGKLQGELTNLQGKPVDPATVAKINQELDDLIKEVGANSPVGQQLVQAKTKLNENGQNDGGTDTNVSGDDLKAMGENLKMATSTLDSDAELQMMQLQSVMSQRQTAIQLTSNLIQTMGDSSRKIADNVGH